MQFLKGAFPRQKTLDGVKIVVDCAHGAAYQVAPQVFAELGAEVIPLGVNPDGRNINEGGGALHPDRMVEEVRESGAALGIALDGDADRVIFCDEQGTYRSTATRSWRSWAPACSSAGRCPAAPWSRR